MMQMTQIDCRTEWRAGLRFRQDTRDRRRSSRGRALCLLLVLLAAWIGARVDAGAETRRAVIVTGASGGEHYAEMMRAWRAGLRQALVDRYRFAAADVRVFVDETAKDGEAATAANLRKAFAGIQAASTRDDVLLVVLLGHGTADGETAKFNLVGPDLTSREWAALLAGIAGRVAIVNTTEASFPFLEALSAKGRVVVTATDSPAQKYATVFPEYFVKALGEASTDLDGNGRTSLFEVFQAASAAVKQHYEQRGQLVTERSLLDDTGDGAGREADAEGPDGGLARSVYLDVERVDAADPELAALYGRRRALEAAAEDLKLKKGEMPEAQWTAEFEKLMIELAQVSAEIRRRSGTADLVIG